MKLYSLLIYDENKKLIYSQHNLDEVFLLYKSFVKHNIETVTNEIIQKLKTNGVYKMSKKIDKHDVMLYGFYYEKIYIVMTDNDYPQYAVYDLVNRLKNGGSEKELWDKFKIPPIEQIKHELDETKTALIESMDKLFMRGEQIENLVERTKELEEISFVFNRETKKLNKCCVIL